MTPLEQRVREIYARREHHIQPLIGGAFLSPRDEHLRVMAVGINAYVGADDWDVKTPAWFATGFPKPGNRFDNRVLAEVTDFAHGLRTNSLLFGEKAFDGVGSLFLTNAIKVFVPKALGKSASQVTDRFDEHLDQWRDEFHATMDAHAAPHIVAIFGSTFWSAFCDSFRAAGSLGNHVSEYVPCDGQALHHANRITLQDGHRLLLVRLRHPAARTKKGSAKWLLAQPDFRRLAARPRFGGVEEDVPG